MLIFTVLKGSFSYRTLIKSVAFFLKGPFGPLDLFLVYAEKREK